MSLFDEPVPLHEQLHNIRVHLDREDELIESDVEQATVDMWNLGELYRVPNPNEEGGYEYGLPDDEHLSILMQITMDIMWWGKNLIDAIERIQREPRD